MVTIVVDAVTIVVDAVTIVVDAAEVVLRARALTVVYLGPVAQIIHHVYNLLSKKLRA